jgi:hypothetical protein
MSPLNSIKSRNLFYFAFSLAFAFGCSSQNTANCVNCADKTPLNPTVNFKISDKLTNENLFFGPHSRFLYSQLKVHHIVNGKLDSATLVVDSARQLFNVNIRYQGDLDTVLMQVGNLKPDYLYLTNGVANQCCLHIFVTAASFNDSVIYNDTAKTFKAKDLDVVKFINIVK